MLPPSLRGGRLVVHLAEKQYLCTLNMRVKKEAAEVEHYLVAFVKEWSLPVAITFGTLCYLLFSSVELLRPIGDVAGPLLKESLPYGMFLILYVTFCKIRLHDMQPRWWHLWLQLSRLAMALVLVGVMLWTDSPRVKLIVEGAFVCVICPTAAAAAVLTDRLGGSLASLTLFTILDNIIVSIVIPMLFPVVEKGVDVPFVVMMLEVLRNVTAVLVGPLLLALLTRRLLPRLCAAICSVRNFGFYMWCINLSIVTGLTIHNIMCSAVAFGTLLWLLLLPLPVALVLFATGKSLGRPYGDNISAGQALGQKNTVVAIWLTVTFLNPLAAVAPGAYVIWQNIINAWQLWYKEKYGYVKW